MSLKDCTSAAEVIENYRKVRARTSTWTPPPPPPAPPPQPEWEWVDRPCRRIINTVAKYFGVTPHQLTSERRRKRDVLLRSIAIYLARELTDLSLPQLGHRFGDRDHSTIAHAVKSIREELPHNAILAQTVANLRALIERGQS